MDDDRTDPGIEPNLLTDDSESGDVFIGAFLGLAAALLGGFLCGLMIDQFAPVGSISLWALGFIAGFAATKLTQKRSNTVACILIVACVLAFVVAEVCWIHWNIVGAETWIAALTKFPLFLKEYKLDAFIAVVFTFFGGQSAYRQTALRSHPA